jgi:putative AdoMet-dependent methyltransferase
MLPNDPFPPSDFDTWAESYDQSTREYTHFPFDGYDRVLETIVSCANPRPGMAVLDLGTGTANLALLFARQGCELTCTDFSEAMLAKAREKLPDAKFFLHDLRKNFPAEINQHFDCIVSAYVFHHFELEKKVSLCKELVTQRLAPGGSLVIGDLSFPSFQVKETFRQNIPDWEEEFYWFADESLAGLQKAGLTVDYLQVSPCAGVYHLRAG